MKESIKALTEMCSIFHTQLLISGFRRKEALKLTQTFIYATLNKPTTQSKEENKNG